MEGSGLEKVFETEYGKNTVNHIFLKRPLSDQLAVISCSKQLFK